MKSKILFGDIAKFSNGKTSPERDDNAKYNVFGSNGIIGKSNLTNTEDEIVIIGRVGSYCGSVYFSKHKCWVTDNAIKCEAKKDNVPSFIYYQALKLNLNNFRVGSGQPLLNQGILNSLEINYFDPHTQKKIAHILSTLDDKIELNRKMNQTLEEMAQALFKSWFVDFDPVHVKMGCANDEELEVASRELGISKELLELFPSEFEESELGMIPEGWEWKKFGDILIPKKGKNITKDTVTDGSVPVVAGGLTPAYYHSEYNAKAPVITVSASGANAGYVNLYTQNIWASDCSYINEGMTKFVYSMYLFLKENQKEITRMQQGAAQPHVYPKDLMRLVIANPNTNLWSYLEGLIEPMFKQIGNNEKEIQTLQKTRDTLLPKLLSGELDVSELEMEVAPIVDNETKSIFDIYKDKFGESFDIFGMYWNDIEKQVALVLQCIEENKIIWDVLSKEELETIEEVKKGNVVF